jgi:prepilin-type N-terminal cleavage/methylation domain-containing protein
MKSTRSSGFTLVELAVVMVIIGLIVGSILVGRDLIKAAELRSVVREVETLKTAINTFKAKYNSWPGDMSDATAYWPTTIDGDNNGVLSVLSDDGNVIMGDGDDGPEYMRLWEHLSLAGLISGSFTGLPVGPTPYTPGVNIPPTRYNHTGGYVMWDNGGTLSTFYIPDMPGRLSSKFLILAGQWTPGDSDTPFSVGLVTPADAYAIDVKTDDGVAYGGSTMGLTGNPPALSGPAYASSACSSAINGPFTDDYNLTSTQTACVMIFQAGY